MLNLFVISAQNSEIGFLDSAHFEIKISNKLKVIMVDQKINFLAQRTVQVHTLY